jgi:septal ring factor EnvC (AmiA/AmiB activator)
MNREISKLKAELRTISDSYKKSEKSNYEFKKNVESKENAIEKLRKERDELWAVVNTDKYRNIKTIESEKTSMEK